MDIFCSVHDIDDNRSFSMSDFNWCHGPECHKQHTQDRIRGVKGSKVLRTKKIKIVEPLPRYYQGWENHFCKLGCLMDYIKEHLNDVLALSPRPDCLETPIKDPEKTTHGNGYHNWNTWDIKVDESRQM